MNPRTAQVALLGRALHVVGGPHDRHIEILQKGSSETEGSRKSQCSAGIARRRRSERVERGGGRRIRRRTLKSELRLARLTVVESLSAPYALRQLCSADIAAARWRRRPALALLLPLLRFGLGLGVWFGCVKFRPRARVAGNKQGKCTGARAAGLGRRQ